jgi:hypothetical protein
VERATPFLRRITIHAVIGSKRIDAKYFSRTRNIVAPPCRRRGGEYLAMNSLEQKTEHKTFTRPDELREFPNGKAEILDVGGVQIGRMIFQPGWRWSNDVRPLAKTSSCEAPHFQYHVAGRLGIRMDDGTELIAGPGDITSLPKGHDAWVIGDEPVVVVDWFGASNYAKKS